MENARSVGTTLRAGLRELLQRVGDVRGRGLYAGVEIVSDPAAKTGAQGLFLRASCAVAARQPPRPPSPGEAPVMACLCFPVMSCSGMSS
jgi:acetylornithine/succinyldiaminopimelate/putrescine aminotransferase